MRGKKREGNVDFASMTPANVEEYGEIISARLTEAERERTAALDDANAFLFLAKELPDVAPQPESFFRVLALVQKMKFAAA